MNFAICVVYNFLVKTGNIYPFNIVYIIEKGINYKLGGANMRKLSKYKMTLIMIAIVITACLIGICFFSRIPHNGTDFLKKYYYERYDGLNKDNFHSRVKQLNKYYSKELLNSDSWLIDKQKLSETYKTISTFDSEAEILSLEINEAEDSKFDVLLYVLYTTNASPENTHYIVYVMEASLKETIIGYEIVNINLIENLPVFTGGQEVVIGNELDSHIIKHNH